MSLKMGELFAGYGGLGAGVGQVLDVDLAWVSEFDKGPSKILAHRFPGVPNHGDITKIDWATVEPVDVLTGGFPCQDVSSAGKRAGIRPGTRSGLWEQFAHAIAQLRPRLVVIENVRGLLSARAHSNVEPCPWCVGDDPDGSLRALGAVLGDLATIGYDTSWHGLRAADAGAPHGRFRVFIVARDARRLGGHEALEHDGRGATAGDWRGVPDESDRDALRVGPNGSLTLLPTPLAWVQGDEPPRIPEDPAKFHMAPNDGGAPWLNSAAAWADREGSWGDYAAAIARWEHVLGRPAPAPTQTSAKGNPQLSARFTEWMMGLPDGWITDVPGITRNEALKACGNGVVPQQAAAALRWMLARVEGVAA